jgi:hypothetical protein
MSIIREEILKGRDKEFPLSTEIEGNLRLLLFHLNQFRAIYGKPMVVSSGYRPGNYNDLAGGAKKSNHMVCLACDFADADSSLDSYCIKNLDVLEQCGLYLEHPKWTKGWCHLQIVKPASGKRIFVPSHGEIAASKLDELFLYI